MAILASGQLKVVPTTIFEVSGTDVIAFTRAIVKKVAFFNNDSMMHNVRITAVRLSGPSTTLEQFELKKDGGVEFLTSGEPMELERGDVLKADATADDVVDFCIFGVRA